MTKIIKTILLCLITVCLIIGILFITSVYWNPSIWGSHSLGKNLYSMEWDGGGQIIVYNDKPTGKTVFSGAYVIPSNKDTAQNLVVQKINYDNQWIIAKAVKKEIKQVYYFIIDKSFNIKGLDWHKDNCDSIIQSHVFRFDSISFYKELNIRNINLTFGE
jgi:uncharacterized phosphosugar-binding protein